MRNFYEILIKDQLLKYTYAKEFLARIDEDIDCLKNKEKNKNMISKYGISNGGGGVSQEEIILNINAEIDLLENNRQLNLALIKRVDDLVNRAAALPTEDGNEINKKLGAPTINDELIQVAVLKQNRGNIEEIKVLSVMQNGIVNIDKLLDQKDFKFIKKMLSECPIHIVELR